MSAEYPAAKRRRVGINFVHWGWYADIPIPFTRYWLIFDVGRAWEVTVCEFYGK